MSNTRFSQKPLQFAEWAIPLSLVLLGILSRTIPHPPNFTALGAVALYAGARVKPLSLGIVLPVFALLATDWIFGFSLDLLWVYASMMLMGLLGSRTRVQKLGSVVGNGVLGSLIFFVVTNFGVWLGSGMYPANYEGLMRCYVLAIPFFGSFAAGTLFYSALIFAADRVLSARFIRA
jgi:hypothetical protein